MYSLWKTSGITISPWREDVLFGASQNGKTLNIIVKTKESWKGLLIFEQKRHRNHMNIPVDYPRINQFPEWYVIDTNKHYLLNNELNNTTHVYSGEELINGLLISLGKNEEFMATLIEIE